MKLLLAALIIAGIAEPCAAQVLASDINPETCRWRRTGELASEKNCNEAKVQAARDREIDEQHRISNEQQRQATEDRKADYDRVVRENSEQLRQQQEKKGAEEEARFQKVLAERKKLLAGKKQDSYKSCTEQWVVNGHFAEMPCDPNNKQPWEIEQEKEEAAMKRKCGKDFQQLRVGMTLQRFEDCNGTVSYVTDTVSGGGVVETYRSTFYLIHVRSDRIVGYTRRIR